MHYQVSRNGQMYGPYTLEDLQRYLASGNILPTDLAKTDDMAEWVPVSQVVGGPSTSAVPSTFSTPGYAAVNSGPYGVPAAAAPNVDLANSSYPDAPNLHWGLVVLFAFLTCCIGMIFMPIWNLIVCLWLKRVQPNATTPVYLSAAVLGLWVVYFIVGGAATFAMLAHAGSGPPRLGPANYLSSLIGLILWVVRLVARFSERASLQEHFNTVEPVGLDLNPVMTFFFGGTYFQYELNRINAMKQAARLGAGRGY